MSIEAKDLRPMRAKFPGKCAVCDLAIDVGIGCYYHIKIKRMLHSACRTGELKDAITPLKRPKIFGIYSQTEIIAFCWAKKVATDACLNLLSKLRVDVTPSTESTITTTYNDANAGKYKNAVAAIRPQHQEAIVSLLSGNTLESLPPQETHNNAAQEILKKLEALQSDYYTKEECKAKIDEAVKEVKELYQPVEVVIHMKDHKPINTGKQHFMFPTLLSYLSIGENVWLTGPAGSGKTRGAKECAKHLKLDYYSISFDKMTPTSRLTGYMDAHGKYVRTGFRDWVEFGGLMLFDEVDAGSANTITAMNDVLASEAGDLVSFPDKMIKKHKDCVAVAAANTYGQGANRVYVGRCEQDGAALDRFTFLDWAYDEALELHIAGDEKWTRRVQMYRKAADGLGIRHIISPRASIKGAKALKIGRPIEEVEQAVIWKGLSEEQIEKIKRAVAQE